LHHAQVFYCGVARSAHAKQMSAAGLRDYPPGEEAKARDFYAKALGLEEIERPKTLADRDGLWFAAPPGHVHLSADGDLALHPRRHFALRVDDLDEIRRQLSESGARFEDATPIPGWRRVYVFDPFGNKIELDEIGG